MERVDFTKFFGKTRVASKSTISTLYIKRIFDIIKSIMVILKGKPFTEYRKKENLC